jgi:hypothetical protein
VSWKWASRGVGCGSERALIIALAFLMVGAVRGAVADTLTAEQFLALNEQAFSKWFTYYYQSPQPELVPAAIRKMSQFGYMTRQQTLPPMAGFIASYLATHPERKQAIIADAKSLPDRDYQTILVLLFLAADSDAAKARETVLGLSDYGNSLLTWFQANGIFGDDRVEPTSPSALDFIWGSFMETGNAELVVPLIGVIVPPKDHKDVLMVVISGAARWSLSSNAKQHPKIMELCKRQIPKEPPAIAAELRKIVEGE